MNFLIVTSYRLLAVMLKSELTSAGMAVRLAPKDPLWSIDRDALTAFQWVVADLDDSAGRKIAALCEEAGTPPEESVSDAGTSTQTESLMPRLLTFSGNPTVNAHLHRPFLTADFLAAVGCPSPLSPLAPAKTLLCPSPAPASAVADATDTGTPATHTSAVAETSATPFLLYRDGRLTLDGVPIPLSPSENRIFACLYAHRGRPVPTPVLHSLFPPSGESNRLSVHISHLRQKLDARCGRRLLVAKRGEGYLLCGDETPCSPQHPPIK